MKIVHFLTLFIQEMFTLILNKKLSILLELLHEIINQIPVQFSYT